MYLPDFEQQRKETMRVLFPISMPWRIAQTVKLSVDTAMLPYHCAMTVFNAMLGSINK